MSEAVLKVVTVVFQDVERFVLDLPSRPPAGGQFDDHVRTDGQIGDKAVRRFVGVSQADRNAKLR